MRPATYQAQGAVTGWTGGSRLLENWLARRCAAESALNLAGGILFLFFGMVALAVTSLIAAGIVSLLLFEANALFSWRSGSVSFFHPTSFTILFLVFLGLTIAHAYKTRWNNDALLDADMGTAFSSFTTLSLEFFSAGPILLILSVQDFSRYARLSRLDAPRISALLEWVFDKGGRATFAEICMAFPKLNAVRVLPQLRDLPGINWWPADGEISISDEFRQTFAGLLGRDAGKASAFHSFAHEHSRTSQSTTVQVDPEIAAWYVALDLPLFAPLNQVKSRYRKLAKIYHPDVRSGNRTAGSLSDDEQMKRINEAYHNILKHSQKP